MKDRKKNTIRRLIPYLMKYRFLLLLAFFMTVLSNLFALIGPLLSGYAIDAIEPGKGLVQFFRVFRYAGLMAVFYVISSVLSYLLSVLMITISRKVVYQMRKDVFDRMLLLPVGYYDTHQTGDIISRISYDIDTVNESLNSDLIQILTTLVTVIGALYMMVMISPQTCIGIFIYRTLIWVYDPVYHKPYKAFISGAVEKSWNTQRLCGRKSDGTADD